MILWIDEFGTPHVTTTLDSSMIEAINNGVVDVYRFNLDTEKYQCHNGIDWITVK